MPTIDINIKDLSKLVGKKFNQQSLEQALIQVKGEIDGVEGENFKVDVKDTNRPDLWSVEGIARELKAKLEIEMGLPKFQIKNSGIELIIDKSVAKSRPYMVAAVAKNVKITDELLEQLVQLQEKMGMTFGRKRTTSCGGLYDLDQITPPIYYKGYKPGELKFAPLEFEQEMNLDEILEVHPKGKEYKHLLEGKDRYPIVIDSKGIVASMPPIINSNTTGKVTSNTKNLFVEVTGWKLEDVMIQLRIFMAALYDRGATIESIKIKTSDGKTLVTPDFNPKELELDADYIRRLCGFDFSNEEIIHLLKKARYDAKISGKKVKVKYPAYRQDILHPVDVIEDVLISYDYNKIPVEEIKLPTVGNELKESILIDEIREVCVGLGCQEILTFTMTSKEKQANLVDVPEDEEFVEIANYVSTNWQIFRKQLYPELLEFLKKNQHAEYPQKIFEVGRTLELDETMETKVKEKEKVCIAISDDKVGFTQIKSYLDALTKHLKIEYDLKETDVPSLTTGRSAKILINGIDKGLIGEISEQTRNNFGIDHPICILELEY